MPLRFVLSPKPVAAEEGVVVPSEPERSGVAEAELEDVFRARETQGSRAMYNTECVMEDAFKVKKRRGRNAQGMNDSSFFSAACDRFVPYGCVSVAVVAARP
jgi:hypothetical protein